MECLYSHERFSCFTILLIEIEMIISQQNGSILLFYAISLSNYIAFVIDALAS